MPGETRKEPRALNLPDFCAAQAVLAVVLIVTLTAVVLAVARQSGVLNFWLDLARTSLFLLWTGMGSAAVLCLLRERLAQLPLAAASAVALGGMLAVITLVSWGVLWLGGSALLGPRATNLLLPDTPWRCVISPSPANGAATSSCRRAPACARSRRASVRIFSSTA